MIGIVIEISCYGKPDIEKLVRPVWSGMVRMKQKVYKPACESKHKAYGRRVIAENILTKLYLGVIRKIYKPLVLNGILSDMKSRQDIQNMQPINLDPYPSEMSLLMILLGHSDIKTIHLKSLGKTVKYQTIWYFNKVDGMFYIQNVYFKSHGEYELGNIDFYRYGHIDMHILETIKEI
jgi:hypothetical protein